jgi:hypothetical protein
MAKDATGRRTDQERRRLQRLAAVTTAAAVTALWITLYRNLPKYPPSLGFSLAIVAMLFLSALALLRRMHGNMWPGIAQFGFIISAVGLGSWIVGGTLNALGLQTTDSGSVWERFALGLIAQPQPGWGLFSVGLIPIGVAAIRRRLSLPMRFLLPLGGLFALGPPLKYFLGERTGGLTVLVAFGVGWLVIGALLLFEAERARAG